MDSRTRIAVLACIALGSLVWGANDLRKGAQLTPSARVQSWAQVVAGLIGLGFIAFYMISRFL